MNSLSHKYNYWMRRINTRAQALVVVIVIFHLPIDKYFKLQTASTFYTFASVLFFKINVFVYYRIFIVNQYIKTIHPSIICFLSARYPISGQQFIYSNSIFFK